jgi:hypothetical protein
MLKALISILGSEMLQILQGKASGFSSIKMIKSQLRLQAFSCGGDGIQMVVTDQ